jgi:cell division GTPase FtsZ
MKRAGGVEAVVVIMAGTDGIWKGAPYSPCGMAANVVLKSASKDGILSGAVVTQPFSFEGPR